MGLSSVTAISSKLSVDNVVLLKAERERDIGVQGTLYTNPMSKRAIEHNMPLADIVADLVDFCETFYFIPHLLYICLFPNIIYFPVSQLLFSVPLQLLSQLCG